MDHLTGNIFDLESPQDHYCAITSYRFSHSLMLVTVTRDEFDAHDAFYVTFSEALYIEAPFRWKGADFHIASEEECENLLVKIGYSGETLNLMLKQYHIFFVELPNLRVRILASRVDKSSDPSSIFPWPLEPIRD